MTFALVVATACLVGIATAQAASNAAEHLLDEQIALACDGGGGTIEPGAFIERDLTGDGQDDLIISHEGISCDNGSVRSVECGAQICTIRIYVREGGLLQLNHETANMQVSLGDGSVPRIEMLAHGGARVAIQWNGSTFVQPASARASETASSPGTSLNPVTEAQRLLNERGFDVGRVDGKAGRKTRAAITAFRRAAGLPINTEIDDDLLAALREGNVNRVKRSDDKPAWIIQKETNPILQDTEENRKLQATNSRMWELMFSGQIEAALAQAEIADVLITKVCGGKNTNCYTENAGNYASFYVAAGRYTEAEARYRMILAMDPTDFTYPEMAESTLYGARYGLDDLYRKQGKIDDSVKRPELPKVKRSAIDEENLAKYNPEALKSKKIPQLLVREYEREGKYAEAEHIYRELLAQHKVLAEKPREPIPEYYGEERRLLAQEVNRRLESDYARGVATYTFELARTLHRQDKTNEAVETYREAFELLTAIGQNHPFAADSLTGLAEITASQGNYEEATGQYERALSMRQQAYAENHPEVAKSLSDLASIHAKTGDQSKALNYSRQATETVIAHAKSEFASSTKQDTFGSSQAGLLDLHVSQLFAASSAGLETKRVLANEALETAQWAAQSSSAAAVRQMAARFAGSDALGVLVRESQDLVTQRDNLYSQLSALYLQPEDTRDPDAASSLREDVAAVEARISDVAAQLQLEYPDYAALASPQPLSIDDTQQLLQDDEALVFFLVGTEESHVFAVTTEAMDWKKIPLGADALSKEVAAFRHGLDVEELYQALARSPEPTLFDLNKAANLYSVLVSPIEELIVSKRRLLFVPTGALTALPFHLLVSGQPSAAPQTLDDYRDVDWLIKRHAITVLPSVASLKTIRVSASRNRAQLPMVAFADPIFGPEDGSAGSRSAGTATVAYGDFWQGAAVDRELIRQSLPRLADTADEVNAVADKLGALRGFVLLRGDASETSVKGLPLDDFQIVYFATHGLVAGDIKGVGEPSLVLTIPDNPSEEDDGLLTASEVAQLKLNADWVVLSACNTIAGDKPGAEALSGLTRAFFYAGARALLVSHWAVDSAAATRLTTTTFAKLRNDPGLDRAEALRQAMLDYLNDMSNPRNAYPAFWAPFVVVGEG